MEPLEHRGTASQWLSERGWNCRWIFWEGDFVHNADLWNDLRSLGIAEDNASNQSWLLFNPCPILETSIDLVETELRNVSSEPLSCLDIGCGSGRDLAWLLARKTVAIDSSEGAVQRTRIICKNMAMANQLISGINAKVLVNGDWRLVEKGNPGLAVKDGQTARLMPGYPTMQFFTQEIQRLLNHTIPRQYDMIITIRFLARAILPQLPQLLKPGGFLIISHFVDHKDYTYDQPRPEHRLQVNELASLYGSMPGISIIVDKIEHVEDGRPVNSFIMRKDREA
jgi:SAM-dependent methyltransferase